jgi:AcrR family transcriptional regulator
VPRVSKEHLEGRRDFILQAASRCFARDGFHQTTIADVIRESGLSNGSVYLYFKTKAELLSSVITRTVEGMAHLFRDLTRDCDDPAEAVVMSIRAMSELMNDPEKSDVVRLFPQIFSELGRNDALRERTAPLFGQITDHFEALVRTAKQKGTIDESLPDRGTANLMVSLFEGYIIQRLYFGRSFNESSYFAAIRAALRG